MLKVILETIGLTFPGLVILLLVSFSFLKNRITESYESKIFLISMLIAVLSNIFEILFYSSVLMISPSYILSRIFGRLTFILSIAYLVLISIYFIGHTFKNKINNNMIFQNIVTNVGIILILFFTVLSFEYGIQNNFENGILYILYIGFIIAAISLIISLIFNKDNKLKLPMVCIIVSCILLFLLNSLMETNLNCIRFLFSTITIIISLSNESTSYKLIRNLENARALAEKSDAAQTSFLLSMSHEIRTPLATIMGYGQSVLTKNEITSEELNEVAWGINSSSNELIELIDNIINVSELQNNNSELIPKYFNISTVIIDINNLANSIVNNDVDFKLNINENIPSVFNGDVVKITSALKLLIKNVIHSTEYGFVEVSFNGGNIVSNWCNLVINIKNSGKDTYRSEYSMSFEDYITNNKLSSDITDKYTLGMIIAKRYIEIMNGKMIFSDVTDNYCDMTVEIPLEVVNPLKIGNVFENKKSNIQQSENIEKQISKEKLTALVVDDYLLNVRLLKELLESLNINVDYCGDPKRAIRKASKQKYDLLFIDKTMPEIDGVETISIIKKGINKDSTYILLLEKNEQNNDNNIENIVTKPVKKEDILKYTK